MITQPLPAHATRRTYSWFRPAFLGGITAIAVFLRFWNINTRPGIIWDETTYTSLARSLVSGGPLQTRPDFAGHAMPFFYQPPFYFWELAGWDKLIGQTGIDAARWLAALTSLTALVLLYHFLHQAFGRTPAMITVGLLSIDAWMTYANRVGWMENSAILLIVASVYLYWRAVTQPATSKFVIAGLCIGTAILFKYTDTYVLLAVLISWLISRQDHRRHLWLVGVVSVEVIVYLLVMTVLNQHGGNNPFWEQIWQQAQRTFGSANMARRGSIDSVGQLVDPLVAQYRIFVGTIIVAILGVLLVVARSLQCLRHWSWSPVRGNQILFAWALASVAGFAAIKLRYPSYFELVLVPLYAYLVTEGVQWVQNRDDTRRLVISTAALVTVTALGILGFTWRIVDNHDNAIGTAAAFAQQHIPANAIVLTEDTIANEITQPWCNIQWQAYECQTRVTWIITYTSATNPLSALDATTQHLLTHSVLVTKIGGFEETIEIWRVTR